MVAGASTETMTDLRQFCSRHAAHFSPGAGVWHRKQLDQYFAEVGRVIKKSELTEFGWYPSCIGFLRSRLLAASFDCSAACHVGSWHETDMPDCIARCPLSGAKRKTYAKRRETGKE